MTHISDTATAARETHRSTDGKFGTQPADESQALLESTPTVEPLPLTPGRRRGEHALIDAVTKESSDGQFTRIELSMRGRPEIKNRSLTAKAEMMTPARAQEVADRVQELAGQKVSVLTADARGNVNVVEGTCVIYQDRPLLLEKGSRTKGRFLGGDGLEVLDVAKGYGKQEQVAEEFREFYRDTPQLEPVGAFTDFEDIPSSDGAGSADQFDTVQAVYMYEHPGFGSGPTPGCLFMVTDRQESGSAENGPILNGQFWAPDGSDLTSENSSMYARDLLAMQAARVKDYQPGSMTAQEAWQDAPGGRAQTYEWVQNR